MEACKLKPLIFFCPADTPQILTCAVLVIIGGAEVLRSTLFFLTGHQKCMVQGGLDNGTLEYHVIVASKPVSQQAHASLAADAGASKHA